jgi:hypothetical protein
LLVQILANTPVWVFVLFVVLLAVGLMQARTRTVRKTAAFLLPAGMIALSLAGISSSFGLQLVPVTSWLVALSLVTLAGRWWFRDDKVQYDPATSTFAIPGSWTPLVVIMAIFFAKYVYAVMRAFNLEGVTAPLFVVCQSAVYGALSGYFAARALNLLNKVHPA